MIKTLFPAFIALALFSCNQDDNTNQADVQTEEQQSTYKVKNHSYGNIDEISTSHLHLELTVDFDNKTLKGVARHKMNNKGAEKAIFDIKQINIEKVTLGVEGGEVETTYTIGKFDSLLGSPLVVDLTKDDRLVNIYYSTQQDAEALDWLAAELTGSKKYPFLYTQGQAILTRSWIPVQDTPENRFTYSAALKVPTLAFFCPLTACSPKLWGPLGNKSEIILPEQKYCDTQCPIDPKKCDYSKEGGLTGAGIAERVDKFIAEII